MSSPEFLFNIRTLSKKWFYDKDEVDELVKIEDEYDQMSYRPLSCRGLEIEFEKLRKQTSSGLTSNYYSKIEVDNFISDLKDLILEYGDRGDINVDNALSTTSLNPVQNKIITNALSKKSDTSHNHNSSYYTKTEMNTKLSGKSDTSHTHDVATINNAGFMSSEDKVMLNNLSAGDNAYVLPAATQTTLGGVKVGNGLDINDGILSCNVDSSLSNTSTNPVQNKVINNALNNKAGLSVATTSNNGLMSSSDKSKLDGLGNTGDYVLPTASATVLGGVKIGNGLSISNGILSATTGANYNVATSSADGLMSSSDKTKLDGIAAGATKITVDTALSSTSTNPVQNKVINSALSGKAASSHNHDSTYAKLSHNHDSTYAKLSHTHDDRYYTESEINTKLDAKANSSHTHAYIPSTSNGNTTIKNDSQGTIILYHYGGAEQLVWKLTSFIINSTGWTVLNDNVSDLSTPPGLTSIDIPIISHTGNVALLTWTDNKLRAAYGSGSAENFSGSYMWLT